MKEKFKELQTERIWCNRIKEEGKVDIKREQGEIDLAQIERVGK